MWALLHWAVTRDLVDIAEYFLLTIAWGFLKKIVFPFVKEKVWHCLKERYNQCLDFFRRTLWRASLNKIIYLPNLGFALEMMILLWYCWLCVCETDNWVLPCRLKMLPWNMPKKTKTKKAQGKNENMVQTQINNMFLTLTLGLILSRPKIEKCPCYTYSGFNFFQKYS